MGAASEAAGAGNALRKALAWGRRAVLTGGAVLVVTYFAVWWMQSWQYDAHNASRPLAPPVDAVVVLGGGMDPDGELNIIGRARVGSAVALLERGDAAHAIFTGFGCETGEDHCSEAAAMHARAVANGADPDRLIVEPNARTTLENLSLSFVLADQHGFRRLAVLTDAFHLTRAVALARLFDREVVPVAARGGLYALPAAEQVPLLARETLAWWYNIGKAVAWQALGLFGWAEAERSQVVR